MAGDLSYRKLDGTMWERVGKTSRGHVLNLFGDEFALNSLRGLQDFIERSKIRVDVINVQDNSLTSLMDLAGLVNLKKIIAAGNPIRFICAHHGDSSLNCWPEKMTSLVELNLAGALLTAIPDLSSMPALRNLILSNNRITESSFDKLAEGHLLEFIDLTDNNLKWPDTASFTADAHIFRRLRKLKRVNLAQNELVADYAYIILAQIRERNKIGFYAIQMIDTYEVNPEMKKRADAIRKTKKLGLAKTVEPLTDLDTTESLDGADSGARGARAATVESADADAFSTGLRADLDRAAETSSKDLIETGRSETLSLGSQESLTQAVQIELAARRRGGSHARADGTPPIAGLVRRISELVAVLDECFVQPELCTQILGKLLADVKPIIDRPKDHQFLFKFDPDEFNLDEIDSFLQHVLLLSERQPQVTRTLLSILVYLSTVAEHEFGQRCVSQLCDMMGGGEDHARNVITVVNEYMTPWLDRASDEYTRQRIMLNLIDLARSPNVPLGLDMSPLDGTLPFIESRLRRRSGAKIPLDSVVEMAAVASETPRLARGLGALGLCPSIAQELRDAQLGTPRYQALLALIRNLAQYDAVSDEGDAVSRNGSLASGPYEEEGSPAFAAASDHENAFPLHRSADVFGMERVHHAVLRSLRELAEGKARNPSDQSGDALSRDCIRCLASLTHSPNVFQELIVGGSRYMDLLFEFVKPGSGAGPVILAAVFEALARTLRMPKPWFNSNFNTVFANITAKLQGVTPLLQYLGERGVKFNQMCKLVPREEELYFRGEIRSVANLHSPSMFQLLVSVIDLITVYNQEAGRWRNPLALRVTQDLNDQNRETFLFACLETPSDEVRLAVVRCLQEIPLAEFEMDEISYLVEMLANVINISSGKTEEVLGGSFRLLTKLCLSPHASGASFRLNFAEKSAAAALSILERNEKRDTRSQVEETRQKRVLSMECVHFLQAASQFRGLRKFLGGHEVLKKMVAILFIENEHASHVKLHPVSDADVLRAQYEPNMVERTLPGRQVEYLFQTLFGERSVSPDRVVAPRVLRRIADVLMGVPDPSLRFWRQRWLDEADDSAAEAATTDEALIPPEVEATYPAWLRKRLLKDANDMSEFRAMANRHAYEEKRMPAYWNLLMGSQVGGSDQWAAAATRAATDRSTELQQHQLLLHFQGLERLLLFLVGAIEKDLALSGSLQEKEASGPVGGPNQPSRQAAVPSRFSVLQLFERFKVPDVRSTIERFVYLSKATHSHQDPAGNGLAPGPSARDPSTTITGRELLLRYFMEESRGAGQDGPGTNAEGDSRTYTTASVSSATTSNVDDGNAQAPYGRQYPGADSVMFAPNAAETYRRDTEITDTLVAALRVIYSLIKDGSVESVASAKRNLRMPKRLRILAFICAGTEDRPVWPQALVGAKFMAIAYELCVMPGLRREESDDQLAVYAIVCAVAKRIVSTLRFFADSQTLTDSDMVIALHTTRTLALIASQLAYVRIPGLDTGSEKDSGPQQDDLRADALDAVWKTLLPFDTVVRSCISLLVSCGARQRSSAQGRLIEGSVREHITQILVASIVTSRASRFEILEELVRAQVNSRSQLRNSYIQDLLNRVAHASFAQDLRGYMEEEELFDVHLRNSPRDGFLPVAQAIDKMGPKKDRPARNGCLMALCIGFRGFSAAESTPPPQAPRKEHLASAVPEADGTYRKVWAIEPPPPLRRWPGTAPSIAGRVASREGAARATAAGDGQSWELDRIGCERILICSFCDIIESPGPSQPQRRLLVLTSEAYYLFGEPREGRGWQVGASARSKRSQDDLYTNPLSFAQTRLFGETATRPRLLWRKPYRALQRVVLGLYGQRIHIKHKLSDMRDRSDPSSLTCLTYTSGVAARMYSFFMQMSSEWAQVETWLGAEEAQINPPAFEGDLPLREALRHLVAGLSDDGAGPLDMDEVAGSDDDEDYSDEASVQLRLDRVRDTEGADVFRGASPSTRRFRNGVEARSDANVRQRQASRAEAQLGEPPSQSGSLVQFATSTTLYNVLPGVLATQVCLEQRGGGLVPRMIVCTSNFFTMVDMKWENWAFPVDLGPESPGASPKSLRHLSSRRGVSQLERDASRARYLSALNSNAENRRSNERELRLNILKSDARHRHSLLDLNDIGLGKSKEPILEIGFGRKRHAQGEVAQSEYYYRIVFYDHAARERWSEWLLPRLDGL